MSHKTSVFEKALLAQNAAIISMTAPKGIVVEAVAFIGKIRMTWDADGKCFYRNVRVPAHDLKFDVIC